MAAKMGEKHASQIEGCIGDSTAQHSMSSTPPSPFTPATPGAHTLWMVASSWLVTFLPNSSRTSGLPACSTTERRRVKTQNEKRTRTHASGQGSAASPFPQPACAPSAHASAAVPMWRKRARPICKALRARGPAPRVWPPGAAINP